MDMYKAIEFLMKEPEAKSIHRIKMENEFFEMSGLEYKKDGETKHLLLNISDITRLNNGVNWLSIIYDHVSSYDSMFYTINHEPSKTSTTASSDPLVVIRDLKENVAQWELGATYEVVYDDVSSYDGNHVLGGTRFVVEGIDDTGEIATTTSFLMSRIDLIDGDIVKI